MNQNNVIEFKKPGSGPEDLLTDLLRSGAKKLIQEALEVELENFLEHFSGQRLDGGRQAIVRNGYLPAREIQTGVGPVPVRIPKVRDKRATGDSKVKFNSRLVPPYLRKTMSIENLLPWLYLKGLSTGEFKEALVSILGPNAKGLSAPTISRLKAQWTAEHEAWTKRSLAKKRYVYWWADGVHFNIRGDDARSCILVVIGVTETGHKEFIAIEEGLRESEQSWLEVLNSIKASGLAIGPELAVGDGALGFWKALTKVFGETRHQRCWVHKTANVLNKLPKTSQPKAKERIHQIWMAETREEATKAFDAFLATYEAKYPKAAKCLAKDRDKLLAFYDFPAQHWAHIRTTNPIESTFATVRLRTAKTRGCVSRNSILSMVYKLGLSAQTRWRKLRGFNHLADVIRGVKFQDGVQMETNQNEKNDDKEAGRVAV